jgi:hypothetical protein
MAPNPKFGLELAHAGFDVGLVSVLGLELVRAAVKVVGDEESIAPGA